MAQTESARAEAFAKQADRSREITLGYVQQGIANANAVRQMKAIVETALAAVSIPHRWVGPALELLSPTTGEWVTGPDLTGPQGVHVVSADVDEDGHLIVILSDSTTIDAGAVIGPVGPSGTMTIGTVTTLAPGSSATVTNAGTSAAAVLNFGIPRGDVGPVSSINGLVGDIYLDPTDVTSVVPTLDMDFTNAYGAPFDFLTRATAGGYRQRASGLLVPTTTNEPVIDFSAGTALGTGFYAAYTNLLLRSEEFDNAAWTKSECTITANAVAAPDGVTTADKIVESSNNADHSVRNASGVATGVATCTFSIFAKAAERSQIKLVIFEASALATVTFDLSAGTIIGGTGGKIESVGNGWYRCSVTVAVATGVAVFSFAMPMSGGVSAYLGNGTSGVYVWGAQLTATAFPVPYVLTTSAAVVRNVDSMVLSGTDFTDFFNPTEGTIFVDGIVPAAFGSANVIANFSDNTYANRHALYFDGGSTDIRCFSIVGSVTTSGLIPSAVAFNAGYRLGFSYKQNAFAACLNGASPVTDVSGGVPAGLTRVNIGSDHTGAAPLNGRVRRLIYWPKALGATELQRMTA